MKKRMLAIFCAMLVALSLVACKGSNEPGNKNNGSDKDWTGFY